MSNTIPYRGKFTGGDPNQFFPDRSACTPQQLENHETFCRIWNTQLVNGETPDPMAPETGSPEGSMFGVGYQGTFEVGDDAEQ